ncbi:MAG: ParB/RepB/Spo0J family partition protein [Sulfuritalea sp.]|jgi:ParB-like chromosome segregation protein Spo0J|nr:ParB/RepB/Spo0J family partition protein [Sulfuritalea sp.]
MTDAEFASLKADVAANGLNQPIVIHSGQILDGGNRYRACVEIGIEPATVEYSGTDPMAFVLSANMHRRHLTESQRAMIAASMANMRQGERTNVEPSANLPKVSQSAAAEMLQVSPRSVQTAAKVERESPAEVVEAVKSGAMSLNLASQVADLPKEEQAIVAAAEPEQIKGVAREAVHNHRAQGTVGKARPEPTIEPETNAHADLLADYEREVAENRALQERIDSLTKDDLAGELDKRIKLYHQLEGRLNQALTTSNEAQREATRKGKVLAKIRAALGVERDSEILPKLKGGAL